MVDVSLNQAPMHRMFGVIVEDFCEASFISHV